LLHRIRSVVAAIVSCFVLASAPAPSHSYAAPPLGGDQELPGHVLPQVANGRAVRLGHHSGDDIVTLAFTLRLRNEAALDQFLADRANPASLHYRANLTQQQANEQYNPTLGQEQSVMRWLEAHGMRTVHTYPNHLIVDTVGRVSQIEAMLHISINDYTMQVGGEPRTFYAPDRNPTVEADIAAEVQSISGLDNYRIFQHLANGAAHNVSPYYPQDFANAYDVNPLWNAGYTGAGQHIAITLWESPPSDATLQRFNSITGANVATIANGHLKVFSPSDLSPTGSPSPEGGIDVEAASGIAPDASVDYYEIAVDSSGNPTAPGVQNALNEAGTDVNSNWQISNSWGFECEPAYPPTADAFMTATDDILKSNLATGHNYFFGSGDNGPYCGGDTGAFYPSASPYVTSVGGTTFSASVNGGYPGETVWNYGTVTSLGTTVPRSSGGGYSEIYNKPSWQSSTVNVDRPYRGYPDVAAVADPRTGQFLCYGTNATCTGDVTSTGTVPAGDGTSLATPLWAGMTALLNQYMLQNNRPILGFLDPSLYVLGNGGVPYAAFHDVTSGTNGGFSASPGWDPATGWGSPDLWNIARDLPVAMTYQAEAGANTLTSPAIIASCPTCSGGAKVTGITGTGKLQFNQVNVGSEGSYQLLITFLYPTGGSQQDNVSVNGDSATSSIYFPASGTPGTIGTAWVVIHLNSGDNTIALTNVSGSGPDIDRIQLTRASTLFEAESSGNSLWAGASIASCTACSGGETVALPPSASMQFNQVQNDGYGPYDIRISYINATKSSISANASIDGGAAFPVVFPPSSGNVGSVVVSSQTLASGNHTLMIANPSASTLDVDKIEVIEGTRSQEAESAALSGSAAVASCAGCSNGLKVTGISGTGQVQFSFLGWGANSFTLEVSYTNPDSTPRTAYMSVNGQQAIPMSFWPTGGVNSVGTLTVPVNLGDGSNSVSFSNSSGQGPDFDKATLYGAR
jgi:Pro-kumamolisin, activation domain